jgi:hypothetical protein
MNIFNLSGSILVSFLLGVPMFGFSAPQKKITQVTILDPDFKVVKQITDTTLLTSFTKYWESKKELQPSQELPGRYKIDVVQENTKDRKNQRYLYDEKKGTLRVLTKVMAPEYQMEDLESFNKLIGLKFIE